MVPAARPSHASVAGSPLGPSCWSVRPRPPRVRARTGPRVRPSAGHSPCVGSDRSAGRLGAAASRRSRFRQPCRREVSVHCERFADSHDSESHCIDKRVRPFVVSAKPPRSRFPSLRTGMDDSDPRRPLQRSEKAHGRGMPARPRKNVQASPTTQLLQTSRPWPSSQSCFASAWCESRGTSSAIQKLVSTNLTIRRPPRRCPWDRYRRCQSRQSADHCIVDSRSRAVTRLDAFSDQRSLGPIVLGHFRPESLVEIFFNIFFNINLYTPHAMSTHSSSRPRLCGQRRAGAPTVSRPGLKGIEGREPPTSQTSDLPGNWKRRSAGEPVPKPVGRDMSGCSGSGRPVYAGSTLLQVPAPGYTHPAARWPAHTMRANPGHRRDILGARDASPRGTANLHCASSLRFSMLGIALCLAATGICAPTLARHDASSAFSLRAVSGSEPARFLVSKMSASKSKSSKATPWPAIEPSYHSTSL